MSNDNRAWSTGNYARSRRSAALQGRRLPMRDSGGSDVMRDPTPLLSIELLEESVSHFVDRVEIGEKLRVEYDDVRASWQGVGHDRLESGQRHLVGA